ncbi:hypothetical protein SARC_17498 [Sphaeroforma arctica JP610]|uniref:Uncharacterized protein n=1 Tax=Sphaeroforma arctica JP610 TaxID=667725 RepID=A0A0L0F006_9EUKA|nr:hypothetical protein SARC_17498 [Sphaeroforma arctica JP610]KNC69981.1 hypothetical protein SARC_17498 [Sphaeroforma arctica JP610]|eukprot:XP_014143883.1 hypothetical protein SARC_17498 [Sphaeroforma arctica JP610]
MIHILSYHIIIYSMVESLNPKIRIPVHGTSRAPTSLLILHIRVPNISPALRRKSSLGSTASAQAQYLNDATYHQDPMKPTGSRLAFVDVLVVGRIGRATPTLQRQIAEV